MSLAACTSGGEDEGGTSGGPSPVDLEAARTTLASADLTDEGSIDAAQDLRFTDAGVAAAREALDAGASGDERWAATWVYATSPTDPDPLRSLLTDPDPSIRLMAASGILRLGEVEGFDALVGLLSVDELVEGSHPPVLMWRYVGSVLQRLTGVDLGPASGSSPEEVVAAAGAWADWLEANRSSLRLDEATGTWSAG